MTRHFPLKRFAALCLFAGAALDVPAQDIQIVRIGQVGPTSGSAAHLGKDNANGVKLAVQDLNARNLMIGGKRVCFELLTEDDGADPKQAVAVAQKLCDQKVNGVVGHLAKDQYTNDKATDFSAVLTAIKFANVEAIFYGGLDAQAGPMLRQMAQVGMHDVRLMGGDGLCTSKLAELAGGSKALDKVVCAEGGASVEKMPGGPAWKQRYEATFPGDFQGNAPYGYDAMLPLAAAMQKANSIDPTVYGPELFAINAPGLTGKLAFDSSGELKDPAVTLSHFPNGAKQPLN